MLSNSAKSAQLEKKKQSSVLQNIYDHIRLNQELELTDDEILNCFDEVVNRHILITRDVLQFLLTKQTDCGKYPRLETNKNSKIDNMIKYTLVFMEKIQSHDSITNPLLLHYINVVIILANKWQSEKCYKKFYYWQQLIFYMKQFVAFHTSEDKIYQLYFTIMTLSKLKNMLSCFEKLLRNKLAGIDAQQMELDFKAMFHERDNDYWEIKDIFTLNKINDYLNEIRFHERNTVHLADILSVLKVVQRLGESFKSTPATPNMSKQLVATLSKVLPKKIREDIIVFRNQALHSEKEFPQPQLVTVNLQKRIIENLRALKNCMQYIVNVYNMKRRVLIRDNIRNNVRRETPICINSVLLQKNQSFAFGDESKLKQLFQLLNWELECGSKYENIFTINADDIERIAQEKFPPISFKYDMCFEELTRTIIRADSAELTSRLHNLNISFDKIWYKSTIKDKDLSSFHMLYMLMYDPLKLKKGDNNKKMRDALAHDNDTAYIKTDITESTSLDELVRYVEAPGLRQFSTEQQTHKNVLGQTALHIAVIENNQCAAKKLIDSGNIDVTQPDGAGHCAMYYAIRSNSKPMVELLMTAYKNHTTLSAFLLWAIKVGDLEIIQLFMVADILITVHDVSSGSENADAICCVVERFIDNEHDTSKLGEVIKGLMANGANINAKNSNGMTALLYAVHRGNREVVDMLITFGADINLSNEMGQTALQIAAYYGWYELLKTLLSHQAHIDLADSIGNTALHAAATQRHHRIVIELLECGAEINIQNNKKLTTLHLAVYHNYIEIVKTLLAYQPNINLKDSRGWTALHWASYYGYHNVVKILLSTGVAYVNAADCEGQTPLHWAVQQGHANVIETLLACDGIDVHAQDEKHRTALHFAAYNGYSHVILPMLINHELINVQDTEGNTPLHIAACQGHVNVIDKLLCHGADINVVDFEGRTPLHLAAHNGHIEACSRLKSNTNLQDSCGRTAMHWAINQGHSEVVNILLTNNADITVPDAEGNSAMHTAVKRGNKEIIAKLLSKGTTAINMQNYRAFTPLQIAEEEDHKEIVITLLQHGARANEANTVPSVGNPILRYAVTKGLAANLKTLLEQVADVNIAGPDGETLLHIAARNGHIDVVCILLEHGAKLNLTTTHGDTALHNAAREGHNKVVEALLMYGAKVNAATSDGYTALHTAAMNGHSDVIFILFVYGADVDVATSDGITAPHAAAFKGHTNTLKTLIRYGANVHVPKLDGTTPLHTAASNGHHGVIKTLLEHGVEVDVKTLNGETALHYAALNGHTDALRTLLEHGAAVNAATADGYTPLHYTSINKHTHVVKILMEYGAKFCIQTSNGYPSQLNAILKGKADV